MEFQTIGYYRSCLLLFYRRDAGEQVHFQPVRIYEADSPPTRMVGMGIPLIRQGC